jgi:hypothetical protein
LQNLSKSTQIKSVMQWLSRDSLAAYIASFHRINLWVRETAPGRHAIALLNAYGDPAEAIEIIVRTESETLTFHNKRCEQSTIAATARHDGHTRFTLPKLGAWDMALLTT